VFEFAGDFFTCCGEGTTERGPWGENAGWEGWFEAEKGVETGGVATACAAGCLPPGVGVAIAKVRSVMEWLDLEINLSFRGVVQGWLTVRFIERVL